jgi:fatty-acid desaturase
MPKKIPSHWPINTLFVTVYLTGAITLIVGFNWLLVLSSIIVGWLLSMMGMHTAIHYWATHKTFEPKNKLIKHFLLIVGTLAGVGSTINVGILHRQHHKFSDREGDPHSPQISPRYRIWFQQFEKFTPSPKIVVDLLRDKDHKFYHNHYYKVHAIYVLLLALIDPVYIGYFWALPIIYVYQVIGYLGVGLHAKRLATPDRQPYNVNDYSSNQLIAGLWMPGEGNHNNHHKYPGAANNNQRSGEVDVAYWFIKLVGKNINEIKVDV